MCDGICRDCGYYAREKENNDYPFECTNEKVFSFIVGHEKEFLAPEENFGCIYFVKRS